MYSRGEGIYRDHVQAKNLFEKAALQGNVDAQLKIGIMYFKGEGVHQDYAHAKEWFGKACDNGNQDGCDAYKVLNTL